MRERLIAEGHLTQADADRIEDEVAQRLGVAEEFARSSPEPQPADILESVLH